MSDRFDGATGDRPCDSIAALRAKLGRIAGQLRELLADPSTTHPEALRAILREAEGE